jgi:hypothetical protein
MKSMLLKTLMFGCLAGAQAWAGTIAIVNPSFEDPENAGTLNGIANGWTVSNGNAGTWNPTGFTDPAPDGSQVLFVGYIGGSAEVSQILSDNLLANTNYTLTFYVGSRTDLAFSTYSVAIKADGNILASDSEGTPAPGGYVLRTISFNSGANPLGLGSALEIDINASGFDAQSNGAQAEFDKFSFTNDAPETNATPEPVSTTLMGAGLAFLGLVRRKKA